MSDAVFDVIVVGSGISGGWAAKEFCEKGLKTLVIERGRNYKHREDYKNDFARPWDLPGRGYLNEDVIANDYPIQVKSRVLDEYNHERFVNDREQPYIQQQPFDWIRGNQTGGRSLLWGRQTYRMSDFNFEENQRDGFGTDWPIRYADLESWYDYVEEFVGVSGNRDGIPHLPDGNFLPPMEMNCLEQQVSAKISETFPGRKMIIGRAAHLTQPKKIHEELGRGKCMYRNQCARGCSFGAYFSSQSATLPAAERTGNLTLLNDAVVQRLVFDKQQGRVSGVEIVDRVTLEKRTYKAKVVFMCASTLGTTQILLNSTSDTFPDGLGNSSGTLGHYLMDHNIGGGAMGIFHGLKDRYYSGRRPSGIYVPRFQNLDGDKRSYLRGFGYQGGASRDDWKAQANDAGYGAELKQKLQSPGAWKMVLMGFGEMLPRYENAVSLDKQQTDRWGMPLLKVNTSWGDNEHQMTEDMITSAVEMLSASGLDNIVPIKTGNTPGTGIHEMGTARMGRDPKTSVLNAHNQMHDVPNVFVTDGSAMASGGCQNPSLTYMALTARAVDYAVKEMKTSRI
ncbi:GMC family oxidoreductase [Aestuariicella hydrocarbonica]|uniref:GMC family oxidoreductase n=1 Tax=Pseudomaricurvus hydrocarbonicus TaxID=1470433 RepID=A0A9E5JY68_9GAMM|nr:GMC family oxidoreductase [Aestuariicella hydrocarbonica]NHO66795.1 GMC family oxidoreductase [Aestuariicella hydrocarbonica]